MKVDLTKKQTVAVRRTLAQLRTVLIQLLMERSFEQITVQELCDRAMISKSTFYAYFEDKFDLLQYLFYDCRDTINQSPVPPSDEEGMFRASARMMEYIQSYQSDLRRILRHNPPYRALHLELLKFLHAAHIRIHLREAAEESEIPVELCAEVESSAFLSLLIWMLLQKEPVEKEKMSQYLQKLFRQ